MKKRALSLFITVCMLLSFIPATAVATDGAVQDEGTLHIFPFYLNELGYDADGDGNRDDIGYTKAGTATPADITYAMGNGNVQFYALNATRATSWNSSTSIFKLDDNEFVAYKLSGITSGKYRVTLSAKTKDGARANIYIIPLDKGATDYNDSTNPTAVDYAKGRIATATPVMSDCNFGDGADLKVISRFEGEFTAGEAEEYLFVIKRIRSGAGRNFRPVALTLDSRVPPALGSATLSAERNTMSAGKTIKTSLSIFDEKGGKYLSGDESVSYKSSDDNVLSVDASGVITAKGAGTAKVTATVTTPETADKDAVTVYANTEEITVTAHPVLTAFSVASDRTSMALSGSAKLTLSGTTNDNETADFENGFTVQYKSTDENVITVSPDGTVTPVGVGSAKIIATVVGSDLKGEVDFRVLDKAEEIVVNFKGTVHNGESIASIPGALAVTHEGHAWSRPQAVGTENLLYKAMGNATQVWPEPGNAKSKFEFTVDVPLDGVYSPRIRGGISYVGMRCSVYVDGKYIGDHNFWDGNTEIVTSAYLLDDEKSYNTIYLESGEHTISFRARESWGDKTRYILLDYMKLVPVPELPELQSVEAELPEEIAVGEVYEGTVQAVLSDGTAYRFGLSNEGTADAETYLSGTSAGDEVVLSDFDSASKGDNGKTSFVLTGTEENSDGVDVTFSAKVGGKEASRTGKIKVREEDVEKILIVPEAGEVLKGDKAVLNLKLLLSESGRIIPLPESDKTKITALTPEIAMVDGNVLTAVSEGIAKFKVVSEFNKKEITEAEIELEIKPEGMASVEVTSGGSKFIRFTDDENADAADFIVPLYVKATSNLGNEVDLTGAEISAEALNPEIATLDRADNSTGSINIIPVYADPENGSRASFRVTVKTPDGRKRETTAEFTVLCAKKSSTYLNAEKSKNARDNIKKFDWAEASIETTKQKADKYVDNLDILYSLIHSNGVPRGYHAGEDEDPYVNVCRYCGKDCAAAYGTYFWLTNAISRQWKVQCPDCKRLFPSNDFEGFYKLGLNEYGEFDRLRALGKHHALIHHGDAEAECDCTAPTDEWTNDWYTYYGYGDSKGYLYNKLYASDDLANVKTLNAGFGLRAGETAATWGVDDSLGYVPRKPDGTPYKYAINGVTERHTYIAIFSHSGLWRRMKEGGGAVKEAIYYCAYAYFYTGDVKYGRVAAILLDRLADLYPTMDLSVYGKKVQNSHGGSYVGGILGRIWESGEIPDLILSYDMVYDMYEDPFVLQYIGDKSKEIRMHYAKNTPAQIRTSIEDNFLRRAIERTKKGHIGGNFGYMQRVLAAAAVVLDCQLETKGVLEYIQQPGWEKKGGVESQGGGIDAKLICDVDNDGMGDEASQYNFYWLNALEDVNAYTLDYGMEEYNLWNHPKYRQMFYSVARMMSSNYTPNIGDSNFTVQGRQWITQDKAISAWENTGDPLFAQVIYKLNGNTADGLHYSITEENPERLEKEVEDVIEKYGQYNPDSDIMTNFGFAILRSGADYENGKTASTGEITYRDTWMYYGYNAGHGHVDTLNLGMTAFGLEYMPDLGYPEHTGADPNRLQWVATTISHNTVTVNGTGMSGDSTNKPRGKTLHYDEGQAVSLVDVSAPYVYASQNVEEYRRSLVTVAVDDRNSYTVDFFRVIGGNEHLYSLHATSNEVTKTEGLDFTLIEDENGKYISGSQLDENGNYKGTYAGRDATYVQKTNADGTVSVRLPDGTLGEGEVELLVEYGKDPHSPAANSYDTLYPRGYTWLHNVDRDIDPENKVEVNFKIKDFNKHLKNPNGLNLYMTVLNEGNVAEGADAEISIADGHAPAVSQNANVDKLKYVLVKNTGENLATTFTTVFEPYRTERYLGDAQELSLSSDKEAEKNASARAVKITHVNGRVDYVFWATDNSVMYTVSDNGKDISFRGFVGVYSVNENGEVIYRYLHDGDILGEEAVVNGLSEITGKVKSFTGVPAFENEIVLTGTNVSALGEKEKAELCASLSEKLVVIENNPKNSLAIRPGAFKIIDAEFEGSDLKLNIGGITPIQRYTNLRDDEGGYDYQIAEGQAAKIALTFCEDKSPEFTEAPENVSTSAGSTVNVSLKAESPIENMQLSYEGATLPRGASVNPQTGVFTWKPDSSQVGKNHIAITARDSDGREATIHFDITVYGSTTGGSSSEKTETPSTNNTDTPAGGGGGGGGGGAAPSDEPDDTTNTDEADTSDKTDDETTIPDASGETEKLRFTDLGNHAWAADAINALADDGIIRGTTSDTYSPGHNITRADFASLLVRAFELSSDNAENFADVSASDYFASELAIARNNGIINGIGDNNFAPRNTITRQDMMVIVYRALEASLALKGGGPSNDGGGILPSQYPDFTSVASYAKEAVTALIGAGLVNGKSGRIAPTDYTTRAEVAVLIKRILDYIK